MKWLRSLWRGSSLVLKLYLWTTFIIAFTLAVAFSSGWPKSWSPSDVRNPVMEQMSLIWLWAFVTVGVIAHIIRNRKDAE